MDNKEVSTKGLNNEHEILKKADTEDKSEGMVKYSIDLDQDMDKLSQLFELNNKMKNKFKKEEV